MKSWYKLGNWLYCFTNPNPPLGERRAHMSGKSRKGTRDH
jgi:hypothetical protein